MSLTKLTTDLENIQALSDKPNEIEGLTADELKAKFDKAGSDIKTYINDTLTTEVDSKIELLTPKDVVTGLNISGEVTTTAYRTELAKAKLVVFYLKTAGANPSQVFYMKSLQTGFTKYCLGNNSDPLLGLYISVKANGDLLTSSYQYDGFTEILGFATFY